MTFLSKIHAHYKIQSGETKTAIFMPKFKQLTYWKDSSTTTSVHCENKMKAQKIIDASGVEQELEIRK
jgi:hypothetical protein